MEDVFQKWLVENIKQTLINNVFPNYIVDEQIKRLIKMLTNNCTTPGIQKYLSNFYSK